LRRDRQVGLLDDILFPDILEERLYLDLRRDGLIGLLDDILFPDILEERFYLDLRRDRQVGLLDDILFPDIHEERLYLDLRRDRLVGLLHDLHDAHSLPDVLPAAGQEGERFTLHPCSSRPANPVKHKRLKTNGNNQQKISITNLLN
jgi:hypothetical protein